MALGRFVLPSLSGPLAVQLCFTSAFGSDRTLEFLPCEEVSGGPQVVLILGLSAGAAAPCLFHAGACGLFLCGLLGEFFFFFFFFSVFLSSACGFLFTAFSRQLAAIGVFYWLLPERFGYVLQFFAAFFFFSCECMLGAW